MKNSSYRVFEAEVDERVAMSTVVVPEGVGLAGVVEVAGLLQ